MILELSEGHADFLEVVMRSALQRAKLYPLHSFESIPLLIGILEAINKSRAQSAEGQTEPTTSGARGFDKETGGALFDRLRKLFEIERRGIR